MTETGTGIDTKIDYAKVNQYWEDATPSILGPYMMDDFGFPVSAGNFRFQAESRIVERLTGDVKQNGAVLDLGSGIGTWAESFRATICPSDGRRG